MTTETTSPGGRARCWPSTLAGNGYADSSSTIAVLIGVAIVVVAVALIAPMFTGPFDPSCGPPLGCR